MAAPPRTDRDDGLLFLALGGAGEIGMNLSLYGQDGRWIMVDCGVTFADDSLPGVDLVFPDPGFIVERRDSLLALFLTHAHEDHLGAVATLWGQLGCPVYATPFTAAILRRKLNEAGIAAQVPVTVVGYSHAIKLGPFSVTYLPITHSIPEGSALLIESGLGTVFHSGDWKLDDQPLLGAPPDQVLFERIGRRGVDVLVCDSTNALRDGVSGSEAEVRDSLREIVRQRRGRVAVATFASHIARVASLAEIGHETGREVALVGRSLWRTVEAAKEAGYLADLPTLLTDEEAAYIAPEKLLLICTGCQGEARGAMSRIAYGDHPTIDLEAGDTVIFSSRIIPGNERTIGRLCNALIADDIEVITEKTAFVHVSGHPARDELRRLYGWLKPKAAVPVHGEAAHLRAHADLARDLGVEHVTTIENGQLLRLRPGPPEVIDHVRAGRLVLDGRRLLPADHDVIRARKRLMHHGYLGLTVVVDENGRWIAPPQVSAHGIAELSTEADLNRLEAALANELARLDGRDHDAIDLAARRLLNRDVRQSSGKRPIIDIQIVTAQGVAAHEPRRKAGNQ
ncbi:MAG: ribonuclease J [Alphaproteobacteria bacterium]|nr:ribonuclease J [Alphaproteobacteria bacterium]